MAFKVSEIFIYPIKSLGGISLASAELCETGFKYDRRWLLVDKDGLFMTQREYPQMALLRTEVHDEIIYVYHKDHLVVPLEIPIYRDQALKALSRVEIRIWDDICYPLEYEARYNAWFRHALNEHCRLVYMDEDCKRAVDKNFALYDDITSFSDAYPLLLIGQSSLDDLNTRLASPVPMNRFRPNIVVEGDAPYAEDKLTSFKINDIQLNAVKPCARCILTTTDQDTGLRDKEPLKTLASYRTVGNKVLFGQNIIMQSTGTISIGDKLDIL